MKKFIAFIGLICAGLLVVTPESQAASFNITTGTDTTAKSLSAGQTGTIAQGATLSVSGSTVAITVTGSATITNNGTAKQTGTGRVIRDNTGGLTLTITNGSISNSTALMQAADADVIQMNKANSNVTLNNYGTLNSLNASDGGAQAVDFNAITTGTNIINNFSTGILESTDADSVRPGVNGTVNNDGTIKSVVTVDTGSDGIDGQSNSGITINNATTASGNTPGTGLIEGARHGITGGNTDTSTDGTYLMTISNKLGGTIQGDNGSGINIDGFSAKEVITITNNGTITGKGVTGDGDGVDVDGLVILTNTGLIKSIQANNDTSEGVTVGGGTIINSGTIEGDNINGGIGRGMTLAGLDKDPVTDLPIPVEGIFANTTVTNQSGGLIKGQTDSGISVTSVADTAFTLTITNNAGATIEGDGATSAGIVTIAQSTSVINSGTIKDSVSGKAVSFGSGNDSLKITGNTASVIGDVDGGTGTNTLTITPGAGNSFSYSYVISNFSVNINDDGSNGTVTLSGVNTYTGGTTVSGGELIAGNSSALGTSTVTLSGGSTLVGQNGVTLANAIALGTGGGTIGNFGSNAVTAYNGAITLNGNNLTVFSNSNGGASTTVSGGVTGTGNLTLKSGGSAPDTANVIISGATVNNTGTITNSGLGSGSTTISAVIGSNVTGVIENSSTSSLILTGTNLYSGGTTVTAGTLTVGNTSAVGTGNVTQNGGTINFGNSVRLLNVGGTFNQTAGTLVFTLNNSGNDQIAVTGAGTSNFSGTAKVDFTGFTPAPVPTGHTTNTEKFTLITTANGYTQSLTLDAENLTSNTSTAALDFTTAPNNIIVDVTTTGAGTFTLTGLTSNQTNTGNYINNALLAGKTNPLIIALGDIVTVNPGALGGYLDQLTALNFGRFASSAAFNNTSFTTQQFDNYLANHRGSDGTFVGSNGGIDSSGLVYNDPNVVQGLQGVHSRLLAWNPTQSSGLLSDVPQLSLGGMDMKNCSCNAADSNPWNVFVSGNVVLSQDFSDPSAGLSHTDATTGGVQVGFDYAISKNFLVGAMFGYGHTDATLDTLNSKAQVDTYSPTVYASYADSGWYANGLVSYGFTDYDQKRNVSIGGFGGTAHSSPSGDQIVGNLDGGYDFHHKGWTYGPTIGLQYVHLDVDGYTETGLPGANLTVNSNEADSLRSRLGGRVSYAWQTEGLVFTPHLDVSWQHEFMDQSRGITSQFDGLGAGSFSVQTASPSRDSALMDIGLDTQVDKTIAVFADYSVQAGQDNYFGQSVQAGVKIGF